jgi:hypothetical protein
MEMSPNRLKPIGNIAFFVLGIVFIILGLNNSAFLAVGIVFLVLGLVSSRTNRP